MNRVIGTMKLYVFPSDQLGSTKDTIDQVVSGQAVITSTDVAPFADLGVKRFTDSYGTISF